MPQNPLTPPRMSPAAMIARSKEIEALLRAAILQGAPFGTVAEQTRLAEQLGTHLNTIRRHLIRMNLVGRAAKGLGPDPRTLRKQQKRAASASALADPELEAAAKAVEVAALDARDPIQRLELFNRLATNAKGDVPYAVQSAALSKIADESRMAGENFGPPPLTGDTEEIDAIYAVLQSATPHCLEAALARLKNPPPPPYAAEAPAYDPATDPVLHPAPEPEAPPPAEAPPAQDSGGDAPDLGGVG